MKILLLILAVLLSSVTSKATDVVLPDTPNLGDTTTISTVTTGNPVTSGNLISQDFDDGTWNGTIFPDNSDLDHSTWLTGKENTYAETVVNSVDYLTIEELKQGFTSNFTADIRWWNSVESTVTMSQTASNGVDITTQSTTFVDTTNHNYQLNNYGNTLIMNADPNMTHGSMTYRFDFDITNNNQAKYNGGHAGVDVTNPMATIDYSALSSTTVTTVEYCWEKIPSTCPATEELAAVEEIIQNIPEEFFVPEDFFTPEEFIVYAIPETIVAYIPEEIELKDDFEPVMYDLPVMEINMEEMQIENIEVEVMTMDATDMMPNFENIEVFEQELSMPQDNYFDSVPTDMDMFDIEPMDTEVLVEMFTAEPEFVEEPMLEEAPIEIIEEPMVEEVSEPVVMASAEPIIEDKPMQEIVMEEEPIDEPEIEEQSSSEELVADEPVSEPETTEQEEIIEEPVEEKVESKS